MNSLAARAASGLGGDRGRAGGSVPRAAFDFRYGAPPSTREWGHNHDCTCRSGCFTLSDLPRDKRTTDATAPVLSKETEPLAGCDKLTAPLSEASRTLGMAGPPLATAGIDIGMGVPLASRSTLSAEARPFLKGDILTARPSAGSERGITRRSGTGRLPARVVAITRKCEKTWSFAGAGPAALPSTSASSTPGIASGAIAGSVSLSESAALRGLGVQRRTPTSTSAWPWLSGAGMRVSDAMRALVPAKAPEFARVGIRAPVESPLDALHDTALVRLGLGDASDEAAECGCKEGASCECKDRAPCGCSGKSLETFQAGELGATRPSASAIAGLRLGAGPRVVRRRTEKRPPPLLGTSKGYKAGRAGKFTTLAGGSMPAQFGTRPTTLINPARRQPGRPPLLGNSKGYKAGRAEKHPTLAGGWAAEQFGTRPTTLINPANLPPGRLPTAPSVAGVRLKRVPSVRAMSLPPPQGAAESNGDSNGTEGSGTTRGIRLYPITLPSAEELFFHWYATLDSKGRDDFAWYVLSTLDENQLNALRWHVLGQLSETRRAELAAAGPVLSGLSFLEQVQLVQVRKFIDQRIGMAWAMHTGLPPEDEWTAGAVGAFGGLAYEPALQPESSQSAPTTSFGWRTLSLECAGGSCPEPVTISIGTGGGSSSSGDDGEGTETPIGGPWGAGGGYSVTPPPDRVSYEAYTDQFGNTGDFHGDLSSSDYYERDWRLVPQSGRWVAYPGDPRTRSWAPDELVSYDAESGIGRDVYGHEAHWDPGEGWRWVYAGEVLRHPPPTPPEGYQTYDPVQGTGTDADGNMFAWDPVSDQWMWYDPMTDLWYNQPPYGFAAPGSTTTHYHFGGDSASSAFFESFQVVAAITVPGSNVGSVVRLPGSLPAVGPVPKTILKPSYCHPNQIPTVVGFDSGGNPIYNPRLLPSSNLRNWIKHWEWVPVSRGGTLDGFWDEPDEDIRGHCSIGFGKFLHEGACTGVHPKELPYVGRKIDLAEAERILDSSIANAAGYVRSHVNEPLTQNEFDALVDLVYCCGTASNRPINAIANAINTGVSRAEVAELLATQTRNAPRHFLQAILFKDCTFIDHNTGAALYGT